MRKTIRFVDMFSGIGGFREGCAVPGDLNVQAIANRTSMRSAATRALFDTRGEWFCDDIRKADAGSMPDFELLWRISVPEFQHCRKQAWLRRPKRNAVL